MSEMSGTDVDLERHRDPHLEQKDEEDDYHGYNFSTLPEAAWIHILQFLPLQSRCNLSMTCHALNEHFQHPSLWNEAAFLLTPRLTKVSLAGTVNMPLDAVHIVKKVGYFFKKLTLNVSDEHSCFFDNNSKNAFMDLSEACRLESLTIEAGKLINPFYFERGIPTYKSQILHIFINFITHAHRLKQLSIPSWPVLPCEMERSDLNICNAIINNRKHVNLTSLSLFWWSDKAWHGSGGLLPSSAATLTLLTNLQNLSHLALKSPMLSTEVIALLASPERVKLKLLQIDIAYTASNPDVQVPDISSDAWTSLTTCSPELKVECSVMTQVPFQKLSLFLKPGLPLSSMTFLQYSRCDGQMIRDIGDKFHDTLQSFRCYASPYRVIRQLLSLVDKCCNLTSLVFHGAIRCSAVVAIATKTRNWSVLEFVEKELETLKGYVEDNVEDDEDDNNDDEVIRRNQDGELYLVDLNRFHQIDGNRKEKIEKIIDIVSGAIGHKWHPV